MYRFLEDKMKTKIFMSLIALSMTFTGCYTSFATREYEEEEFGQMAQYAEPDSMIVYEDEDGNLDTVYVYAENSKEFSTEPVQNLTVVNQYYDNSGYLYGGYYAYPRVYSVRSPYYCWDPYWCDPFYYDYYCSPYYVGLYVGVSYSCGYYSGGYYYPSKERYRTQTSHWTSLRNNDSQRTVSRTTGEKSRDAYRNLSVASRSSGSPSVLSKGADLDRDLQKISEKQRRIQVASSNSGGVRKANLEYSRTIKGKNGEAQKVSTNSNKKMSSRKVIKREAINQTDPKRTVKNTSTYSSTTKRKRVYSEVLNRSSYGKRKNESASGNISNSRKSSTKTYNSQPPNRSPVPNKSETRSNYRSNTSRSSNSSSYYNSSSSKSSRSSYSGSSSGSSSRSSYSGSSSGSSSRSSYSPPPSSSSRGSASSSSSRGGSTRSSGRRR